MRERKDGRWKKAGREGEGRNERIVIPIACVCFTVSLCVHHLFVSIYFYLISWVCISVSFMSASTSVFFSFYVSVYHWIFVLNSCPSLSSLFLSSFLLLPYYPSLVILLLCLFLFHHSYRHTSWFFRVLCSILYLFFSFTFVYSLPSFPFISYK